ncbi:MAG: GTP-binding protein [Rhodospirillales bacterium]
MAEEAQPRHQPRLPLLTVGGFLGAGKTTLVNALLSQTEGRRFVVFVNDFGAINIDLALVETLAEDRISLKNGCVCCSLNGDLVAAVADFARQAEPPDALVIEASGVADPRALDSSLAALDAAGLIRRDTQVYVVDADRFGGLDYLDSEEIVDHAAASDLVLLNKCDLATAHQVAAIEVLLARAAPYSQVVRTTQGRVPLAMLLGESRRERGEAPILPRHADFVQWTGTSATPLERKAFRVFARLLQSQCLRAKGLLSFRDNPDRPYVFNAVGTRATLEPLAALPDRKAVEIVAIGFPARVDTARLERAFQDLLAASS